MYIIKSNEDYWHQVHQGMYSTLKKKRRIILMICINISSLVENLESSMCVVYVGIPLIPFY